MSRPFVVFALTVLLSCLAAIEAASASPAYECQPVQIKLAQAVPSEHGWLAVFRLTNLGDEPLYYPLSEPKSLSRLSELHPNSYVISTRGSEIEQWSAIITLGTYDVWRGVLIIQPGESGDVGVPVGSALTDQHQPQNMFKLEMHGIPTKCKVQSPSIYYRELDKLMFRKL